MTGNFDTMSESGSKPEVLYPTPQEIIPYDRAAFWTRLCGLIKERFPDRGTEDGCIEWLVANVTDTDRTGKPQAGMDRKTIERWCGKPSLEPSRPRWTKVLLIVEALNRGRRHGIEELSLEKLVEGLSKPGARAPAGRISRGPSIVPTGATKQGAAGDRPRDEPSGAAGAKDLAGLRAKVEGALQRAPAFAAALVRRGYASLDPGAGNGALAVAVADALVNATAAKVARDLAELAGTPEHRDASRNVLWHILPLAGDWDDVLEQAGAAGTERGALELRLRTETVAEIVLARVEARSCHFVPGEHFPQGAAHVPLPVSAYTPLFDLGGQALETSVLNNLWQERRLEEPWRGIKTVYRKESDFMVAARAEINTATLQDARRYLLVIDAKFDFQSIQDLDASWVVAQEALGAALPGLRLVRLKECRLEDSESTLQTVIKRVRDLR